MALGDGIEVGPLAGNAEAGVVRSAAPRASDVASAIFFIGISVANLRKAIPDYAESSTRFHDKSSMTRLGCALTLRIRLRTHPPANVRWLTVTLRNNFLQITLTTA
jgi:hypothetical protein